MERAVGHPVAGVDYPRTFQEFEVWFGSEAACRAYIRRLRWPNGFVCPACGVMDDPSEMSRGGCCAGHVPGDVADGRHHLRGDAQAAADVVPGDVVRHQPEERRQCPGAAAGAGARQLRDGLDVAAQAAAGHGPAWPRLPCGEVEVDETYVGGPEEGKRGRAVESKAIVAVVAKGGRGVGRIRLRRVEDVSADSLMSFVRAPWSRASSFTPTDGEATPG